MGFTVTTLWGGSLFGRVDSSFKSFCFLVRFAQSIFILMFSLLIFGVFAKRCLLLVVFDSFGCSCFDFFGCLVALFGGYFFARACLDDRAVGSKSPWGYPCEHPKNGKKRDPCAVIFRQ